MVRPCETRRWFVRAKRDDGSSVRNETMVRPCEARRWFVRAKRDDGSEDRACSARDEVCQHVQTVILRFTDTIMSEVVSEVLCLLYDVV